MRINKRDFNLNGKNLIIILVFVVLAVFLIAATHYGTKTLSAVRAYIAAEGKWTKAQKGAANLLLQYSIEGNSYYYKKAEGNLSIHQGFKQAREALTSENPDRKKAVNGFERAGIHPQDIDLLIWLTLNFKEFPRMGKALSIWEEGDKNIAKLDSLAGRLHLVMNENSLDSNRRIEFSRDISSIDQRLTILERSFSQTMAELARWVREIIFWTISGIGAILLFIGYKITSSFFREINNLNNKLSNSESRFKKVLENSRDVIYQLDFDTGDYEYMSPYVEKMLGYSADQIIKEGKDFILSRIHPEDLNKLEKEVKEMEGKELDEHFARETEFRIKNKSGNYIWVSNHRSLVRDENGNPIHIVGSVRDISDRKKYEVEIEQALKEKQTLLKEIHHRVKNNLAVIYSLLELQKQEPVDSVPSMIQDTQYRVQSIATIHEKLYQSENLSDINIKEYLEEFSELIVNSFNSAEKSIELHRELQNFYLDITTAAPLGLIFNELLSNSFKHGFSETSEGIIQITLTKNDGEATLSVADNGKGLPEDFNVEESGSLGMTLIKTLTNQLSAKMQVTQNEWTKFTISFPTSGQVAT